MSDSRPLLELRQVHKTYPDGWMLGPLDLTVARGEIVCLLGPSGCGKTTLLRLIAGLEHPDSGEIRVRGESIIGTPPHRRNFGLMFQEYALFPHKDVFDNVAFGLRMAGMGREAIDRRVGQVLDLVGLTGFERRDVNQLSGGERQRVALARSLAPEPKVLMLDEPLGALDRALRQRLMDELWTILRQAEATTITVTHDQEEAFALADRVVLMRAGEIVQTGTPEAVYARPTCAWAARFLGLTNLIQAHVDDATTVETPMGSLTMEESRLADWPPGDSPLLLIRPEAATLGQDGPNVIQATITERSFRGERYHLIVEHPSGLELAFNLSAHRDLPAIDEPITLSLDPSGLMILPPDPQAPVHSQRLS